MRLLPEPVFDGLQVAIARVDVFIEHLPDVDQLLLVGLLQEHGSRETDRRFRGTDRRPAQQTNWFWEAPIYAFRQIRTGLTGGRLEIC
jgi:hypothetical protein